MRMHPEAEGSVQAYEFGPFLLDLSSRTLTCSGEVVSLVPKAIELLTFLVEQEGKVLSKNEILDRVWPGTFVEEGNIFQTISVLRKALNPYFEGESPIVTVARRGYRFGAPVGKRFFSPPAERHETVIAPSAPKSPELPVELAPVLPAPAVRSRWPILVAVSTIAVLAAGFFFYSPALATNGKLRKPRRSIAVLPLKNLSPNGESAWVSTALAETVSTELASGDEIRTITTDRVLRMMKDLSLAPGSELAGGRALDIRNNLGCDLVLTGSYLEVNGEIRIDVRLTDAVSSDQVAVVSETDDARNLLGLVVRTGAELRAKMGLPPLRPGQEEGIRSSISPDPNAAMLYLRGVAALRELNRPEARKLFEQAIAADPRFALAHSGLAAAQMALGEDKASALEAKRAFDDSQGLSREDRLNIEALYYTTTSNWAKANEIYRTLWRQFPDNIEYILKVGQSSFNAVKGKDVLAAVDEARAMPAPANADPRIDILETSGAQLIGDYPRAEAAAARAVESATKAKAPLFLATALVKRAVVEEREEKVTAALADFQAAQHANETLGDKQGAADSLRLHAALLRKLGRLDEALQENQDALAISREIGYRRLTGRILSQIGLIHQLQNRPGEAVAALRESSDIARATSDKGGLELADLTLGLVLRKTGDLAGADTVYIEAARLCRELSDAVGLASTLNSSASVNISRGQLDTAAAQLVEAEQLFRKLKNQRSLGETLSNKGTVQFLKGDLASATATFQEECGLHVALKEKGPLVSCRLNQALAGQASGKSHDAETTISEVLAGPERAGLAPLDWAKIVSIQLAAGDLKSARKSVEEGQRAAARSHDPEQIIPLSIAAARFDEASGNTVRATATLRKARAEADRYGLKPLAQIAQPGLADVVGPRAVYSSRSHL